MGNQGRYLNKWNPDFDPSVDVPKEAQVWVRLPNLPIHCWSYQSLQKIGNGLGRFIDKADHKGQYTCARICVEVDLEAGLPEAIKLKVGEWQHYQKLDYEQLPFKCHSCQEHGHFQRNCPRAPTGNSVEEEGWKEIRKGKAVPMPPGQNTSAHMGKPLPNSKTVAAAKVGSSSGEKVDIKDSQEETEIKGKQAKVTEDEPNVPPVEDCQKRNEGSEEHISLA